MYQFLLSTLLANVNPVDRREILFNLLYGSTVPAIAAPSISPTTNPHPTAETDDIIASLPWKVTLPLERCSGGTNCIRISVPGNVIENYGQKRSFSVYIDSYKQTKWIPKKVYRTIIDTGSPYLVLPSSSNDDDVFRNDYEALSLLEPVTSFSGNPQQSSKVRGLFDTIQTVLIPPPTTQDLGLAPYELESSIYAPTEEIYGSQSGMISWRQSSISFRDVRLVPYSPSNGVGKVVLGVLDKQLTLESGGPLLGLVKRSNNLSSKVQLRPTFLDQVLISPPTENSNMDSRTISCFQIDSPNRTLTFLSRPYYSVKENVNNPSSLIPISAENVLPMIDLRPLGDFVEHYTCRVSKLVFNGMDWEERVVVTPQSIARSKARDIVVVFDTGLTGCLLTQELWDILKAQTTKKTDGVVESLDPDSISSVQVFIRGLPSIARSTIGQKSTRTNKMVDGKLFEIQSDRSCNPFFNVSPISLDWFDDEESAPHVVVLGQTFLIQGCLTIDIDNRKLTFVRE